MADRDLEERVVNGWISSAACLGLVAVAAKQKVLFVED
jgi:hypothetical protein